MSKPLIGPVTVLYNDQESLALRLARGDKHGLDSGVGDGPGNTAGASRSIRWLRRVECGVTW
jgi:hypothetical protein